MRTLQALCFRLWQAIAPLCAIEHCLKVGRALREEESVMHSGATEAQQALYCISFDDIEN